MVFIGYGYITSSENIRKVTRILRIRHLDILLLGLSFLGNKQAKQYSKLLIIIQKTPCHRAEAIEEYESSCKKVFSNISSTEWDRFASWF